MVKFSLSSGHFFGHDLIYGLPCRTITSLLSSPAMPAQTGGLHKISGKLSLGLE